MKIFITGSTGYIGHALALRLAEEGNTIHALVRNPASPHIPRHRHIHLFTGNLGDRASIASAIRGCEQVFHVAALAKLWAKNKDLFYDVNVTGTHHVLNEALENGIKKLVFTSSCSVFGPSLKDPLSEKDPRIGSFGDDYDLSKYICESLVKEFAHRGLFSIIVNPSRVYGPGLDSYSNPITRMIIRCLKKQVVCIPGCKEITGNYAYIEDVVAGHLSAMQKGISGERYILGGENLSYDHFFSVLKEEITGANLWRISPLVMKGAAWIEIIKNKVTGIEPAFTPAFIRKITTNAAFNSRKAIQQLDYRITPFREALRQIITHLKTNQHA